MTRTLSALLPFVLVVSCATERESRRLVEIYEPDSELLRQTATSIVFVPGTMGSVLIDPEDDQVVWGHVWDRHESRSELFSDLALPFDPEGPLHELEDSLVPGGPLLSVELDLRIMTPRVRGYPGVFEGIVQALQDSGSHGSVGALAMSDIEAGKNPIIGFGYDWRRDISSEAARLHEVVVAASAAREAATGRKRIALVAHSMGTQLVRYYLRYGAQPLTEEGELPKLTWEGARLVRRVILIGPPNRGEAQAFEILVHGAVVNPFLPRYPPAVVASFPACFQLLPRPDEGRVVFDDGEPVDFFDMALWDRYQWGPLNEDEDDRLAELMPGTTREERLGKVRSALERYLSFGRRFHHALDVVARPPDRMGLHVILGDSMATRGKLIVDRATGEVSWDDPVPGDGTVTRTSALGQAHRTPGEPPTLFPDSVHFVDGEHLGMVGDPNVINHLLYLLLQAPSPESGSQILTAGGEAVAGAPEAAATGATSPHHGAVPESEIAPDAEGTEPPGDDDEEPDPGE